MFPINNIIFVLQTSPKKLVGQRSEGDVISLVTTGQQAGFADFTQFGQDDLDADNREPEPDQQPRRHGAFEVYRKPASRFNISICTDTII